jgi:hypothetical protein
MMGKKGVELSMNVIIIAAIGLLVLIILAVLVINAGGRTQIGVRDSCNAKGGVCKLNGCDTAAGEERIDSGKCDTGDCCSIFKATGGQTTP